MSKSLDVYYVNTNTLPPSPLLTDALPYVVSQDKQSLDLGCGAGRDTKYLLESGYEVMAVDIDPHAALYINALKPKGKLKFVCASFVDFDYGSYDLINARYSLPFTPEPTFTGVFTNIISSLKTGGVFVGQLFGKNDEWNVPSSNMNFHTLDEVEEVLSPLEIIRITEKDEDGVLADGSSKHWHVFDIIARKND